jgi:hypothetical protein
VNYFKKLLFLGLIATTGCQTTKTSDYSRKVDVPILLKAEKGKRGIWVVADSSIHATGSKKGRVSVKIMNLLGERIFLQVLKNKPLSYSVTKKDSNGDITTEGLGIGSSFNEEPLFKILESATYSHDNRIAYHGSELAIFNFVLETETDLKEWIGGEAEITIPVFGYLQQNGLPFYEVAKIPVKIIKGPSEKNDKK